MANDSKCPDELWTKTLGTVSRDYKLCELCSGFSSKATWGHAVRSQDYGSCSILWVVQRSHCRRGLGNHQIGLEASNVG